MKTMGAGISCEDINITNDYMFQMVMQDPELCIALLENLLCTKIQKVKYYYFSEDGTEIENDGIDYTVHTETQKSLTGYWGFRGVRLDAYVDDGKAIYNIEMQATVDRALPKRSRLYQSHIDVSQLQRGVNYDQIRPCYVIFICNYDPFGLGLCRYCFQDRCDESPDCKLNDGAYKMFFNTTGTIGDVTPSLRELLAYMNDPNNYPVVGCDDDLIRKIDHAVKDAQQSEEWRNNFMNYRMKQREAELRGESVGEARGIAIGEERGIAIGEANTTTQIVKNMVRLGRSIDEISHLTGIPTSKVAAIQDSMN